MSTKRPSFSAMRTTPLSQRKADSREQDFAAPYHAGGTLADFLCSLPNLGMAGELFAVRDAIVRAHRKRHTVLLAMGGQFFDAGLSPLLIRLIEQGVINGLALTGAAMIRDIEITLYGNTFTSSIAALRAGDLVVPEETGRIINEAINLGASENWGIGQSLGKRLLDGGFEHLEHSVIATAHRYGIPLSVHPAMGADTFHFHPSVHGESMGAAAMLDVRLLTGMLADAAHGVVLNIASNAIMPRVLLMALSAARNLGHEVDHLHAVDIDVTPNTAGGMHCMQRLSRPKGRFSRLQGPDELIVPLLFAAVIDALGDEVA